MYCSAVCSAADWKLHKPSCDLLSQSEQSQTSRAYVKPIGLFFLPAGRSSIELMSLSVPHQPQEVNDQAFAQALCSHVGSILFGPYKVMAPTTLLHSHILIISTRRRSGVKDLTTAFEILEGQLVAHDDLHQVPQLANF